MLDALDVSTCGNNQPRVVLDRFEVARQKKRDLAGVRRPDDQREAHWLIVVSARGPRGRSGRQGPKLPASRAAAGTRRSTWACARGARPTAPAVRWSTRRKDQPA